MPESLTSEASHFYTAHYLNWESVLVSTKVKVELQQNIDIVVFFERCIPGRIIVVGELTAFLC